MTLNGYFMLNSVFALVCLASGHTTVECMKTKNDRHILLAAEIFDWDSSFWQYKGLCGYLCGFSRKEASKDRQWGRFTYLFSSCVTSRVNVLNNEDICEKLKTMEHYFNNQCLPRDAQI